MAKPPPTQLDLFAMPSPDVAKAHPAEHVGKTWMERENSEGSPEFRAMTEMLHFIDYLKLNDWQQRILWPHLRRVRDSLEGVTGEGRLQFELGYVVGSLEVEQLRSRSAALEIAQKYGISF